MTQAAEHTQNSVGFSHIKRKTASSLLKAWREIKTSALYAIKGENITNIVSDDVVFLKKQMELCLDSRGGEVTERAHTANLGRTYLQLDEQGRYRFLHLLAGDFGLKPNEVVESAQAYIGCDDEGKRHKLEIALREAMVTPRSIILKQFTALPDGFKFLVDMRADLLPLVGSDASLKSLEYELKEILSAWFDVGLLDLVEITWKSPAALLEKLIEYEAVHKVASWDDLKNRLDSDRRVFAFLHNKMPYEPLIFVHVALVPEMSDNIQRLLDEKAPAFDIKDANTAIFYSISNAQKGLAGISFGNFLIKRVVSQLTDEMHQIDTYATLSPVPGFRGWLDPLLKARKQDIFLPNEIDALRKLRPELSAAEALEHILSVEWAKDAAAGATIKPILLRLCVHFLTEEKRGNWPLDPVAKFHLFNGARLEKINWLADVSPKGMKQSAGIMVNYHYKLDEIDDNHEAFVEHGKIVTGKQVKSYSP
ncbi:MAG: malonyl-CoA decarboxylase [Alphaproteobacteria bacterium]